MPEPLDVRLDDRLVAQLRAGRRRGDVTCRYVADTLDQVPGGVPLLSCSLPVSVRRLDASVFCRGLLPEGRHLDAMAREAGVPSNDTFGLLARFGADVAGALVIGRVGPDRRDADVSRTRRRRSRTRWPGWPSIRSPSTTTASCPSPACRTSSCSSPFRRAAGRPASRLPLDPHPQDRRSADDRG